jgi:hypothetical protein
MPADPHGTRLQVHVHYHLVREIGDEPLASVDAALAALDHQHVVGSRFQEPGDAPEQ